MRLRSLDVFRGLTMAAMVIVNNPGDWNAVYAPLLHAAWHGWTPTDLIFPAFLFIVGASMALGAPERLAPAAVLRRGAVLVVLGLFLAGFPYFNPSRWRVPGVLQRIGLCYVVAAFAWHVLAVRGDVVATTRRLGGAIAACLLGYWALIALVPPPGGTAGDLTPEGNLGAWLDRAVFGTHLWKTSWDPEGLLSSLPAVGTTLMGVVAGQWIGRARPVCQTRSLVTTGVLAIVAGALWDLAFPINKALWTSSYALFTGGVAMAGLGLLHRRLDDGRSTPALDRWTEPLVALGRNALLLFVLSGLVAKTLLLVTLPMADGTRLSLQQVLYRPAFTSYAPPHLASLFYAVANLALLGGLLHWLHRRRLYWSV